MSFIDEARSRDRVKAALGVAAFHLLLFYALLTGLGVSIARQSSEKLNVFDVPLAPPPDTSIPAEVQQPAPEGAAAPPSLHSRATPVVAPKPEVVLPAPPPLVTAPEPLPAAGTDRTTGGADVPAPGTGSGGEGASTGSGGQGSGTGGGGTRARRLSGEISGITDYPKAAKQAGLEGSVRVRFTVQPDGISRQCTVTRSSGHPELDETTCRLIERRFRYDPARDAAGRAVPEQVSRTFDWLLPYRRAR